MEKCTPFFEITEKNIEHISVKSYSGRIKQIKLRGELNGQKNLLMMQSSELSSYPTGVLSRAFCVRTDTK